MQEMMSLTFMQNAFLGGILVSVACGVVGSLVVINRMTFIAGGVAHGAYGGIGLAFYFGFAPLLGASVFSIFLALLVAFITLKDKDRFDSVIGAIWAFGMALGIILIDLTPGYNVDLMSYLFGSILAINSQTLTYIFSSDVAFILLVLLFYRQFSAISFDSEFAKLRGVNSTLFYYTLVVMMAFCVVATIQVVGLILVIALMTIPPYIAEIFSKKLGSMMFFSSLISAIFCTLGLILSYKFNLTSGASIIIVASVVFFTVVALKRFRRH
ncbi:metal ABC transporter permease [Campylobacter geochelonis]|uniref:Cation ABC transporter permease protein n=1 Tax=Campylobacter geochelonis TaxID=1780362 RepID=A0A128ECH8_9BACT|nr:metal ABC transporter permease [Campylobacter geochelonis]QKF70485.1 metal ion ABC transporter, membrane protein [Campylobacter geochelonis]CZE46187.1 cation ABC transporter permease protein [Campylobacter geochelonis]CZE46443.1 cation ABC transporter permease protein [Campylobacter geochelonis]CZE50473.1 cation ABC transporter permease protein [Campylobacter geochelonis]